MSEHGVIGVLCSDQQGLALSGQCTRLVFISLHLTFAEIRKLVLLSAIDSNFLESCSSMNQFIMDCKN